MATATKKVTIYSEMKETKHDLEQCQCDYHLLELDNTECWLFVVDDYEDFVKHQVAFNGFKWLK